MRSWALRRQRSRLDDPGQRGGLQLEFFPILTSTQLRARSAVACGLDDLDAMVALVNAAGAEEKAPAGASKLRNWRRAA